MSRLRRLARRRALTLIEVMVALGVLVILLGGIFLIVRTSLATVLMIDNSASRQDEITNLVDILRLNFRNLPARAEMVAGPVPDGNTAEYLFIVRNAPGFLTWLAEPEPEDLIVLLSLRQDDANGLWRVCMKRFAPPNNFPRRNFDMKTLLRMGEKVPWLELVGDFVRLEPRFFDGQSQTWKEKWDHPAQRPALIEFVMVTEQALDRRSQTAVLWLPPVKGNQES